MTSMRASAFHSSDRMRADDFYADYLGKKSEVPYEYLVRNRFAATCPDEQPETLSCKNFGVGSGTVVTSTLLRGAPTNLNHINRSNTSIVLFGTAPYKFGYDINAPKNVDDESDVRFWQTTFAPQRIISEADYDRFDYVDVAPVVEPFDRKGRGTRFDPIDVLKK